MPGTDPRQSRRGQYAGITKTRSKNAAHGPPHITITGIINSKNSHIQISNECRALSRQCSPAPIVKPLTTSPPSRHSPPPQVVLFYDHINGNSPAQRSHEEAARYCRSLRDDISLARNRLQALLPKKESVIEVAEHASSWMNLYHGLYSLTYTFRTGFQLIAIYDKMHSAEVHPVLLSMWLLSVAISLQQAPPGTVIGELSRSDFVLQVCDIAEEVIVRKNILAGSVEGLETCMLLLMLASGRNDLTTIVLTLQRLLALAELMGLPRAGNEYATQTQSGTLDPHIQARLRVWEVICAIDRNFGMMLKLPLSTTSSTFPLHRFVWRNGVECSQAYNYHLARACGSVISIDRAYSNDMTEEEAYQSVTQAEEALKMLESAVPLNWLRGNTGKPAELIVKFWHPYITVRSHLRPAMIITATHEKDRKIVYHSCAEALRMFVSLRGDLPRRFFYNRVLDIQAFTTAILLLLFGCDDVTNEARDREVINRAVECFQASAQDEASSFARKAAAGIANLQSFVLGRGATSMTVHIPLLGNLRVTRKNGSDIMSCIQEDMTLDECIAGGSSGVATTLTNQRISFTIDFENDSPWTPPASRAGGYGYD